MTEINKSNDSLNINNQPTEENYIKISLVNQSVVVRKRKLCPLASIDISQINYKNIRLLNKFISERGKIIPRRISGLSMSKQKAISNAIKKARHMGLISPIKKDYSIN